MDYRLAEVLVKRVLMVAYHFRPVKVSSGIQRTLRIAQYLPDSGWTHVAVSYDGATFSYFMGGIPQFSARIDHLNGPAFIASETPGGGYDGLINELRVWSRVLGAYELGANMHKRLTAGVGLTNAYGFDRGTFHDRLGGPDVTLRGTFSFVVDRTNLRWLHP